MVDKRKVISAEMVCVIFLALVIIFVDFTCIQNFDMITKNFNATNNYYSTKLMFIQNQLDQIKNNKVNFDFTDTIRKDINSVVSIDTDIGSGSGFFVSNNGYVITNNHVIIGSSEIYINMYNGSKYPGRLVAYNESLDLALLKINVTSSYLVFDDSNYLQLGQRVIAIGNPAGLPFSVSEGIISSINRDVSSFNNLSAYIQTDTALNPGNSGSPLINSNGKVIGMNNLKVRGGENLGFALEGDYIYNWIKSLNLSESKLKATDTQNLNYER